MKNSSRFSIFPLILLLCFVFGCSKKEEKTIVENKPMDDLQLNKIPQVVMDGLKAKFPGAEIHKWAEEKEGDIVIYDFEFRQEGRKFEADVKEDGSIYNWEKAIEAIALPEAARIAVETKYPGAPMKEIMEITSVIDGQDVLEGYEVVLETAGMKEVEVTVAPGGEILEDSGEDKPEEE